MEDIKDYWGLKASTDGVHGAGVYFADYKHFSLTWRPGNKTQVVLRCRSNLGNYKDYGVNGGKDWHGSYDSAKSRRGSCHEICIKDTRKHLIYEVHIYGDCLPNFKMPNVKVYHYTWE